MRTAQLRRTTAETDIFLTLNLDGKGDANVQTGCGFLDHMLTLFSKHGRFDLNVSCTGDTDVDDHHTVEDVGIVLGQAFKKALGEKRGISRYGDTVLPMDEALILSAVDCSGRSYLGYELPFETEKIGTFDTQLVEEFWFPFVRGAGCTLHIRKLDGQNSHHVAEGAFKSVARSLRQAVAVEEGAEDEIPSTKGVLE